MPFQYSLQSVLRLRESFERQEEQRLFAFAAVVARIRAQLEEHDRRHRESRIALLQELSAGSSGAVLQFSSICDAASAVCRKRLLQDLQQAENQRLAQLRVYQSARQKREILEGLRERQEAVYQLEFARREQQRADEFFLLRRFAAARDEILPVPPANVA